MNCECCSKPMTFLYDVEERDTRFLLWECECGERLLQRSPLDPATATATATATAGTPS